jgi:hypothetical protein
MKFLLSLLLSFSFSAQAYLLGYDTIMSRTAKNHGRGGYQIQQVVQWKNGEGVPFEILETWDVLSESKMRLSLQGLGRLKGHVNGQFLYDGNRRLFRNENGQTVAQKLPATFSPVFFHFRNSKRMRERLVALKMAPRKSLEDRAPLNANSEAPTATPQDFLSLQRVGGVITYGIGDQGQPSLFIEQDQFVVTQINFPSGPSVVATGYKENSGGMFYPQELTYSWADQKISVTLQKVLFLGRSPKANLTDLDKDSRPLEIPAEDSALRDFYKIFR